MQRWHRLAAGQSLRHPAITARARTALYVLLTLLICSISLSGTPRHALAAPHAPRSVCCGTQVDFVTNYQGFDACTETSTANMQTWWNDTHYAWVNVYIGGPNKPS